MRKGKVKEVRRIGLYVRVSTKIQAQAKEGSLKSQVQRLKSEVERRNMAEPGWGRIVDHYVDEAKSGKNTNRPDFQRMLEDIRNGRVDTVIVTELSRLSRSVKDFLGFIEFLGDFDADFVCPQINFDTTTPAGRVFITILVALAQFERELTAERTKLNMTARAQRGLYNGGHPPLGYDLEPTRPGYLVINAQEAALVRRVFESYKSLGSTELVAQAMNKKGLTNKTRVTKDGVSRGGKQFDDKAIRRIIGNVSYLGKRPVEAEDGTPTLTDAVWPAIVDDRIFQAAQEKLEESRNFFKPEGSTVHPYLLTGIIRCGTCQSRLTGAIAHGRTSDVVYYQHPEKTECPVKRVNAKTVEKEVLKRMRSTRDKPELARFIADGASKDLLARLPQLESEEASKEQEIREANKKGENLLTVLAERPDGMDARPILELVKSYQDQAAALAEEKERLKIQIQELKGFLLSDELVRGYLQRFFKNFDKQNLNERRDVLKYTLNYVEVLPDKLVINYWGGAFSASPNKGGKASIPCVSGGRRFEYGAVWGG